MPGVLPRGEVLQHAVPPEGASGADGRGTEVLSAHTGRAPTTCRGISGVSDTTQGAHAPRLEWAPGSELAVRARPPWQSCTTTSVVGGPSEGAHEIEPAPHNAGPSGSPGSHVQLKHATKPGLVTLPHPKRDLPAGTVRSVEKQAGVTLLR